MDEKELSAKSAKNKSNISKNNNHIETKAVLTKNGEKNISIKTKKDSTAKKNKNNKLGSKTYESPKMSDEERAEAKKRVTSGVKNPITYYYQPIMKERKVEFIEIFQLINDKFVGRLNEEQYKAVAEQTNRIFDLDRHKIEFATDIASKNLKCKFIINLSSKWFQDEKRYAELVQLIERMSKEVYLAFDAVSPYIMTEYAMACINKLMTVSKFRIILDNVENRNSHLWLGYHPNYIRLDARYFNPEDERYSLAIKFYKSYCDAERVRIIFKEINYEKNLRFLTLNGVDILEGIKIYPPKKTLMTILREFNLL